MAAQKLQKKLQKKVVGLDVVKRPLRIPGSETSRRDGQRDKFRDKSSNLVSHEGCVATTSDGQKYLIEMDGLTELYRIGGDQGSRIVMIGSKLLQDFRLVKKVTVKKLDVTLLDLLNASGGVKYDFLCNNCLNATQRMQELVSDESDLSCQMKSGIGAGILGLIIMVLFVFLRRK